MANKNRVEGAEAIVGFMHDARLPYGTAQDTRAELTISAKAGDKWRLTKVPMSVSFRLSGDAPEVLMESLKPPFYKEYRPEHGTHFSYDMIKRKLFIEGYLNKGRGDPYVLCLSR